MQGYLRASYSVTPGKNGFWKTVIAEEAGVDWLSLPDAFLHLDFWWAVFFPELLRTLA